MPNGKICLAAPWFVPLTGGGQTRYARYLPGLRARGIELELFSGTPKPKKVGPELVDAAWRAGRVGAWIDHPPIEGIPVRRVRLPDAGPTRAAWFGSALVRHCWRAARRPAVVQWMGEIRPAHHGWIRILRLLGVRTVFSLMIAPEDDLAVREVRALRRLYDGFDDIIANSETGRTMLAEMGVETPVHVISNGVNRERFRPVEDEAARLEQKRRLGFDEKARIVLAVGAVSPRKGSDLLVSAWRRLAATDPNARLVFAGARKDQDNDNLRSYRERLGRLCEASGAADRIDFTGYVSNVEEYMRAAELLVLASEREGLPNSILEAHASRLPVIVTPYRGLSGEIGEPDRHLLLCERSADALSDALLGCFSRPEAARARSLRAYEELVPELCLERTLDRHAALYGRWTAEAVGKPRPARPT